MGCTSLLIASPGREDDDLLEKVKNYPEVPMNPYNDRPGVIDVARRAVERAGHKPSF